MAAPVDSMFETLPGYPIEVALRVTTYGSYSCCGTLVQLDAHSGLENIDRWKSQAL